MEDGRPRPSPAKRAGVVSKPLRPSGETGEGARPPLGTWHPHVVCGTPKLVWGCVWVDSPRLHPQTQFGGATYQEGVLVGHAGSASSVRRVARILLAMTGGRRFASQHDGCCLGGSDAR